MIQKPDSLIFDMDGTLWDATPAYVQAWNQGLEKLGYTHRVDRPMLDSVMGWERDAVYRKLFPNISENEYPEIYKTITDEQDLVLPAIGGRLYEGVAEGLEMLSKMYKLFIVSNCPANTINQMMKWAGIHYYITDSMAHGSNLQSKAYNITLLVEKHMLKSPVYVGDMPSDQQQCETAKVPFAFVSYGFGQCTVYDYSFPSFSALCNYFLSV